MGKDFNVYAIVLTWNSDNDTINCIKSLKNLNNDKLRIILVDNGSEKGFLERIEDFIKIEFENNFRIINESDVDNFIGKKITLIKNDKNKGFSAGNNIGIKYALKDKDAKYFWILNNDTEVKKDSLNHLIEKMQNNNEIGICGTRLVYFHNKDRIQAFGGGKFNKYLASTSLVGNNHINSDEINEHEIERQVDFIIGASMFVRRDYFEKTGVFCEDLFIYFEDVELCIRRDKFKLGYSHKSIVYHKEGATIGGNTLKSDSKTFYSDYFYLRNKLLITKRRNPLLYPIVLVFGMGISFILRIKRRQFKRAFMIFKIIYFSIFKKDKIFIKTNKVTV